MDAIQSTNNCTLFIGCSLVLPFLSPSPVCAIPSHNHREHEGEDTRTNLSALSHTSIDRMHSFRNDQISNSPHRHSLTIRPSLSVHNSLPFSPKYSDLNQTNPIILNSRLIHVPSLPHYLFTISSPYQWRRSGQWWRCAALWTPWPAIIVFHSLITSFPLTLALWAGIFLARTSFRLVLPSVDPVANEAVLDSNINFKN